MKSKGGNTFKKTALLFLVAVLLLGILSGCQGADKDGLDPKKPVTITVWHYYSGAIQGAFDAIVTDFNETVGKDRGIIVESFNYGNVYELEKAVLSAIAKEVGSQDVPNIFSAYADTAYEIQKTDVLVNLDDYLTKEEQAAYLPAFIEEGRIGQAEGLTIFPIAKSTEVFMLNDTDFRPFADEMGISYTDLETAEGIAQVSGLYYDWTDAKTPDIPNDGKAFYGRDSMANLFILTAKAMGQELFTVKEGECTLTVDEKVMRKLWDVFYIPYISGHYTAYGKFRSDDVKVGNLLCYVGSTASAAYFPSEVVTEEGSYPIKVVIMPTPYYADGQNVMIQQGAGMLVTKADKPLEVASAVFLKFFTEAENNSVFSALSGYIPVKADAMDYDVITKNIQAKGHEINAITAETIQVALTAIGDSELYTSKAFEGAAAARDVLEFSLSDKAKADREAVEALLAEGMPLEEAVASFAGDEGFNAWLQDFTRALEAAIGA